LTVQSVTGFLQSLQALPWAVFIHKNAWAFTTVEVVHVFAVAMVLGTIVIVDLRLLGWASTKRPFVEFSRQLLPFTWAAFVLAVISGGLLFSSRPLEYVTNPVYWIKMGLIVLAGINMLVFEFITARGAKDWNLDPTPPPPARLAGGISITCWILVVVMGRLIGFTLQME
jgi:uncharacterized membrane protein